MSGVAIVGAAAISPAGSGWRGLADASPACAPTVLGDTHPGVRGFEVPPIPPGRDAGDAKARRLMSRAARFAAIVARDALAEAGWTDRRAVGYWLGVGASGGSLAEIAAILRVSAPGGELSMARLGDQGLAVASPLQTFQVLNNFTMCHGAILEGTGGPNGAFFSRGAGTVHALAEAVFAIESGDCARALAGGADTALHPVTWAELQRGGLAAGGLVPSEGAGVVALEHASAAPAALAFVEHVVVGDAGVARDVDLAVIAPWGDAARQALGAHVPGVPVLDVTLALGESLAATPALAWLIALDRIVAGRARRVAVLSMGPDGDLGVVVLGRPR